MGDEEAPAEFDFPDDAARGPATIPIYFHDQTICVGMILGVANEELDIRIRGAWLFLLFVPACGIAGHGQVPGKHGGPRRNQCRRSFRDIVVLGLYVCDKDLFV